MPKTKLGADVFLYPMPVTLVGANVNGWPNFLTVAFCGIMNPHPPVIYAALNKSHHTNSGIKQNCTFSVNVPSADMVRATDYCGLASGHDVDKSRLFQIFYGELGTAPMIEECPLNMECRLIKSIDLPLDEVFMGEIVQSYGDERYLTEGLPDVRKLDPMAFTIHDNSYWKLGEKVGKAWSIGKNFIK